MEVLPVEKTIMSIKSHVIWNTRDKAPEMSQNNPK